LFLSAVERHREGDEGVDVVAAAGFVEASAAPLRSRCRP
jgi:hypothetical protein